MSSNSENSPGHDRQSNIRRLAKMLRDGGYSYDQSRLLNHTREAGKVRQRCDERSLRLGSRTETRRAGPEDVFKRSKREPA